MKLIFQCGKTSGDPWYDVKQFWNSGQENSMFTCWDKIGDAKSLLYFFEKQENKLILDRLSQDENNFYLIKPFFGKTETLWKDFSKKIDIEFAINWLKKNENSSLGFGYFFESDSSAAEPDVLNNSIFYSRIPSPGGHILDVQNNVFLTDESKNSIDTITFFYVYKMLNHDIFFFILNPNLVIISNSIESKDINYDCRIIPQNDNGFSDLFLKPKVSMSLAKLENNWYYTHKNSFIFEPGKLGVMYEDIKEIYNDIKIISDLEIKKIDFNKYQATFKKGQNISFLSLRLNTSTNLDWALVNSKNRLVHNMVIQKFYQERE